MVLNCINIKYLTSIVSSLFLAIDICEYTNIQDISILKYIYLQKQGQNNRSGISEYEYTNILKYFLSGLTYINPASGYFLMCFLRLHILFVSSLLYVCFVTCDITLLSQGVMVSFELDMINDGELH